MAMTKRLDAVLLALLVLTAHAKPWRALSLSQDNKEEDMRKIAMLVGVVALITVLFASVALAVDKQCTNHLCNGAGDNDRLFERDGEGMSDSIYGRAGRDVIRAEAFNQDTDLLYGNRGDDRLNANDNGQLPEDTIDSVYGGKGFDICIVDAVEEIGGGCEDVRVDPGEA